MAVAFSLWLGIPPYSLLDWRARVDFVRLTFLSIYFKTNNLTYLCIIAW